MPAGVYTNAGYSAGRSSLGTHKNDLTFQTDWPGLGTAAGVAHPNQYVTLTANEYTTAIGLGFSLTAGQAAGSTPASGTPGGTPSHR
jgi:hypothetical protein